MPALLARAMSQSPDASALIYRELTFSYAEFHGLVDSLATWLQRNGVGAGSVVCAMLQNVPHGPIATFATWRCGGIAMPCNPMYQRAELARLLADARPEVVICEQEGMSKVQAALRDAGLEATILVTAADDFGIAGASESPFKAVLDALADSIPISVAAPRPDDVALLLYTSGTTGEPKGAMLLHRNLAFSAEICRAWFALDNRSKILAIAPLFHITGLVCHQLAAVAAACPIILGYRFQADEMIDLIRKHRPTFTIGAITAFIALMGCDRANATDFASFETIYSGGAPIPEAVLTAFERRFAKTIHLSFGMTETAAPALLCPRNGVPPFDPISGTLAVGISVDQTDAKVVDDDGREVPRGTPGELLIRGPQVMAGYWGRSAETAAALVDGWLRTGDVAMMDDEKWCYIVDRKKDMICASGFKVWPREVEDVLYALDGVREVVVVGQPDNYRGETVKAYVSVQPGAKLDIAEAMRFVRSRLAAYKCPRDIELLDELPKTITGKLSRITLRQRAAADSAAATIDKEI